MHPAPIALALSLATVLPAFAQDCAPAYRRGFHEGVEAVNAQLGAVTARMQQQVQAQVNVQLAELDARRTAELERRLAEAQNQALADRGPVTAAPMPRLPPLTMAPSGGIVPQMAPAADPRPDDLAALPPGTTITITDPQNLPPDLFHALLAYAAR